MGELKQNGAVNTPTMNPGGLSAFSLKIIAMLTMLIDHIGAALIYYPYYTANLAIPSQEYIFYRMLRNIGRAAFPIYCFLLVEGFFYSQNRKKYALRLGIFCLISEPVFDMAINTKLLWEKQNVYFTLLIGFVVICCMHKVEEQSLQEWKKCLLRLLILGAGMGLAWVLKTDYSYKGILVIAAMYQFRMWKAVAQLFGFCVLSSNPFTSVGFALPFFYHGKRGRGGKVWQYFCYAFYPLHLLFLYCVRKYMM